MNAPKKEGAATPSRAQSPAGTTITNCDGNVKPSSRETMPSKTAIFALIARLPQEVRPYWSGLAVAVGERWAPWNEAYRAFYQRLSVAILNGGEAGRGA